MQWSDPDHQVIGVVTKLSLWSGNEFNRGQLSVQVF